LIIPAWCLPATPVLALMLADHISAFLGKVNDVSPGSN
jgi:hypothetical protein